MQLVGFNYHHGSNLARYLASLMTLDGVMSLRVAHPLKKEKKKNMK